MLSVANIQNFFNKYIVNNIYKLRIYIAEEMIRFTKNKTKKSNLKIK